MMGMSTAAETADMEIPATLSGTFADIEMVAGLPAVGRRSIPSKIQIYFSCGSWHVASGFNWGCNWAGENRGVNLWA